MLGIDALPLTIILFSTGLLAGTIDAMAGGGGLISIPVLMATGLPAHVVLGTNKLQSAIGTGAATLNFFRHGFISLRRVVVGLIAVFVSAAIGSVIAQILNPNFLSKAMIVLLLAIFVYSLLKPKFGLDDQVARMQETQFFLVFGSLLGFYDGFFGPGTGSFWAMAMVYFLGFNLAKATAYTKIFNLESNLVALVCFMIGNNVNYKIGLTMACGQIIGGKLGSHLVIKRGAKFVRPFFLSVVFITIVIMLYRLYR